MVLVCRALTRLVTFVLLAALALAGLLVALFAIGGGGASGWSLPGLAELARLADLRDTVGAWFVQLEAPGSPALYSTLGGLCSVVAGVIMLIGSLAPRREPVVVLESDRGGRIAARRRPLADIAALLAARTRGVTVTQARVSPARRGRGGRLRVLASHPRSSPPDEIERQALEAVEPLASGFGLKARVRPRLGESGARVQ